MPRRTGVVTRRWRPTPFSVRSAPVCFTFKDIEFVEETYELKGREQYESTAMLVLVWNKRIWRCREELCATCTWTEQHEAIAPRASLTERAGFEICRRVGEDADSVAAVGWDFGVGWACAMNAVAVHGRRLVDDPDRIGDVGQIGLDETAFQRPSKNRGHTSYITGFVDLARRRLLDVVLDRTGAAVDSWLSPQPAEWLAAIGQVALDPHRGYANGLTATLPHATVVDRFHAVGLANSAVDDVRRRVQQETLGHRGRNGDPLYGIRRLLLRGYERLTDRQLERIDEGLVGDQAGSVSSTPLAVLVSCVSPLPSAFIARISRSVVVSVPELPLAKAIRLPSGDHVGSSSATGVAVSCLRPLPLAFITEISLLVVEPD